MFAIIQIKAQCKIASVKEGPSRLEMSLEGGSSMFVQWNKEDAYRGGINYPEFTQGIFIDADMIIAHVGWEWQYGLLATAMFICMTDQEISLKNQ